MADNLDWKPLRSSNVARAAYDSDAGELLVEFVSGATYAYQNQSESSLDDLVNSSSPGSWVARWLKPLPARRISAIALALLLCGPVWAGETLPLVIDVPTQAEAKDAIGVMIMVRILDAEHDRDICVLSANRLTGLDYSSDDCVIQYRAADQSFVFPKGFSFRVERK
jgi:hypothetical protein